MFSIAQAFTRFTVAGALALTLASLGGVSSAAAASKGFLFIGVSQGFSGRRLEVGGRGYDLATAVPTLPS